MASEVAINLVAKADTTGAKQMSSAFTQIEKSATQATKQTQSLNTTTSNFFKSATKQVGRTAFSQVAQEAISLSSSLSQATGASRVAISAITGVASSVAFLSGPISLAVAGIASLISVIISLNSARKASVESIQKETDETVKQLETNKRLIETAMTLGNINRQAISDAKNQTSQIESQAKLTAKERSDFVASQNEKIKLKEAEIEKNKQVISSQQKLAETGQGDVGTLVRAQEAVAVSTSELTKLKKELTIANEGLKGSLDILAPAVLAEKDASAELVALYKTTAEIIRDQEKQMFESRQYARAEEKKSLDSAIEDEERAVTKRKDRLISTASKTSTALSSIVDVSNKKIFLNSKKAAGELIKLAANESAAKLEIKAGEALASGQFVKAAALIAGAAAVRGLGNSLASSISSGGEGGGGGVAVGGGSTTATEAQTTQTQKEPSRVFNVNVQGVISPDNLNRVLAQMNDLIQTGGGTLNASGLTAQSGVNF